MSDSPQIQRMVFTDDTTGEEYEIYVQSKPNDAALVSCGDGVGGGRDDRGDAPEIPTVQMQQATKTIRGFAVYAINAFKNFSAAKVEEVNLKFGLTVGGKAGIPYVTEGSAESNLEIEVKCTFPDEKPKPEAAIESGSDQDENS